MIDSNQLRHYHHAGQCKFEINDLRYLLFTDATDISTSLGGGVNELTLPFAYCSKIENG